MLEVLNHPNITRFLEVYKTKNGKLCIVMEHCDDGDLFSKIKAQRELKKYFSEEVVLNWFT